MKIEVYNRNKVVKDELSDFITGCIYCSLGMWGITKNVKIMVDLNLDPKLFDKTDTPMGGTIQLKPNHYIIFINYKELIKMCKKNSGLYWGFLINTISHECVHVKQFINKELKVTDTNITFKGKDITQVEYSISPHEKEAYKYQEDMAMEYFIELSYSEMD